MGYPITLALMVAILVRPLRSGSGAPVGFISFGRQNALHNLPQTLYLSTVSEKEKNPQKSSLQSRFRNRPHIRPAVYGYLTEEKESLRQGFAALFISSVGELIAGVALASITGTLEELVGLAVLIPAAIGMRGAIFGAMGSRLSTAIQTGLFQVNLRRGILAENVQAAIILSLISGVFLAFLARYLSDLLGVESELSVLDYAVISTVGGIIAGVLLVGITILVARLSVSRGWDMDNIAAPMLTAAGDILTLPALVLATTLIGIPIFSDALAAALILVAVVAVGLGFRLGARDLRRILAESLPILALSGIAMTLVGLALEDRREVFFTFPGPAHPSASFFAGGRRFGRHTLQPALLESPPRSTGAAQFAPNSGLSGTLRSSTSSPSECICLSGGRRIGSPSGSVASAPVF